MSFILATIGLQPTARVREAEQERERFLDPRGTPHVLVFAKEHRDILIRDGWTKQSIREFITENAFVPLDILRRLKREDQEPGRVVNSPDDLLVVAAGGNAGRFSSVLPGWSWSSRPVTVAVD
jgi:hypothetical protein